MKHLVRWKGYLYAIALLVGVVATANTELGRSIDFHFAAPISFGLRDKLGRTPPRSERVRAIAYDDFTVAHLKALSPTLEQWRILLQGLAAQNPEVILIDNFPDDEITNEEEAKQFIADIKSLKVPVHIGTALHSVPIVGRAPFTKYLPEKVTWDIPVPPTAAQLPHWITRTDQLAFAAPPLILDAFASVGQMSKAEFGRVPAVLTTSGGTLLPHVSLNSAGIPHMDSQHLTLAGQQIPLDSSGRMLVNFMPIDHTLKGMWNLRFCLRKATRGEPIPGINAGDVILIMTGMYTGHGDWNLSPYGIFPAGVVALTLIHNALTKSWLHSLPMEWLFLILLGALGILIGARLKSSAYWLSLSSGLILVVFAGLAAHAYLSTVVPWFFGSISFVLPSLFLYTQKLLAADKDQWRLKHELMTARIVQNQLFPATEIIHPRITIAAHYEPAAECGGDFWDQFKVADGRHFIVVGDAVGHGASAALIAAAANATCLSMSKLFEGGAIAELAPAAMLKFLNTILFRSFKGEVTMTCFVAEVDLDKGIMRFANAGHVFPLHMPAPQSSAALETAEPQAKVKMLMAKGDPLGVSLTSAYSDKQVVLQRGEQIFFYTDGITEAWGPKKVQYGSKRLHQFATQHLQTVPKEFIEGLIASVRVFQSDVPQGDDMTSILLTVS